jgi:N-acyl-D-amino-acid deacylase
MYDLLFRHALVVDGTGAPGFTADVALADGAVLFDPATFSDTATFEDPCQYPVGLAAVTVAGRLVVHGDRMTGERPGRFCRPDGR